ncbi:MAG: amino acid ABC transporter substrate-binding protein [Nitriliruptoraceae bacterium]|nr:amino acid ABC transporter substrate-binding protein [Nitriliruptoraceae bacterium]
MPEISDEAPGHDATAQGDTADADTAEVAAGEAGGGGFTVIDDGRLTVCSDVPFAPFGYPDDSGRSGYRGFDIDLIQAIADALELELSVREVGFDSIRSGTALAAGQCDVAASALTIDEEQTELLEFSAPYYDVAQTLIVLADSDVSSLQDTSGAAVGVQEATAGYRFALENAPEDARIVEYATDADLFAGLLTGTIAAGVADRPVSVQQARSDDRFALVEEFDTEERFGFAVVRGNTALLEAIDASLEGLRSDGTYDTIYDDYFDV